MQETMDARESFMQEIGAGFFGEYLVSQHLVSREALDLALAAQKGLKKHLKIGELLVKRGDLGHSSLFGALKEYKLGIRIGEILVHQGDIGFMQLLEALDRQQETGCQLGEALVSLGHCPPAVIEEALELQKALVRED